MIGAASIRPCDVRFAQIHLHASDGNAWRDNSSLRIPPVACGCTGLRACLAVREGKREHAEADENAALCVATGP